MPSAESSSEQHAAAWRQVFEKGDWIGELVERTKDGREIIVEGHWTLVRDAAGIPKSILCINTDITERKKLIKTKFAYLLSVPVAQVPSQPVSQQP